MENNTKTPEERDAEITKALNEQITQHLSVLTDLKAKITSAKTNLKKEYYTKKFKKTQAAIFKNMFIKQFDKASKMKDSPKATEDVD